MALKGLISILSIGLVLFMVGALGASTLLASPHHGLNLLQSSSLPIQLSISQQVSGGGLTVTLSGTVTDPNAGAQLSTGSVEVQWGDGTTSFGLYPIHTYSRAGSYTITISARDSRGFTGSTTRTVNIAGSSTGGTTVSVSYPGISSPSNPTSPSLNFQGQVSGGGSFVTVVGSIVDPNQGATVTSATWDWGDGSSETSGLSPQHSYAQAGQYTISGTVEDSVGQSTTESTTVSISPSTAASIQIITTGNGGQTNLPITIGFTAPVSGLIVTPQGNIHDPNPAATTLSATWDWGDGSTPSTGWPSGLSHTYSTAGTYTITLTAVDDLGNRNSQSVSVSVGGGSSSSSSSGSSGGIQVQFTLQNNGGSSLTVMPVGSAHDTAQGSTFTSAVWDWGDGTPDTHGWPSGLTHTYAKGGTYIVTFSVVDNFGQSGFASQTISLAEQSLSGIQINVNYHESGLTVTPSGNIHDPNSAATTLSATWDWGDGSTPSTGWPSGLSHTYASAGQYPVTVSVIDDLGQTNTNIQLVTVSGTGSGSSSSTSGSSSGSGSSSSGSVSGQPISMSVSYSASGLTVTPSGNIHDPNSAATSITATWNWGDGQTSSGWPSGLSHTYASPGQYTITLTAADNIGTTNSASSSITVSGSTTSGSSGSISGQPISISVSYPTSGYTVTPQGTIHDPNSAATSLTALWSWGDGTTSGGWPSGLSHTYITPGQYLVTISVKDNLGITNTQSSSVNVAGTSSSLVVTGQPISINVNYLTQGLTVTPQGTISDPNTAATTITATWSWGDGTTSSGWPSGLSHTYSTAGSYTIKVTATDNIGTVNQQSNPISV